MTRLPSRRAVRPWLAAAVLLAGCLDDGGVGPDGPSARLALRAQFGAVAVTGLRLEGSYLRSDQSSVALAPQALPLPADRSPGAQASLPITIDLASCLADPLSVPGGGACTVTLALVLLDGSREVDRVAIGPLVLRPGETATPPPVQLREASNVDVTSPSTSTCVRPGQTLQLAARLLDAAGNELTGRTFTWATNAPAVATVDASSGLVTGVAPGDAAISATAGGRTGEITVTVCPLARIALAPASVSFDGYVGFEAPASRTVSVTNSESGTLGGLGIGTVVYGSGAAGWLTATLSSPAAPTTLVLRPSRTDLPAGTYTAVVPILSADAANSPQTVTVVYTVEDVSNYSLYIDVSEPDLVTGDVLFLRAVLIDPSENEVEGVPVAWTVSPSNAGSFTPSAATGSAARYVAGSYQGYVSFTVTAGSLSAETEIGQNAFVSLRGAPGALRRTTTTTAPARTRAPGGTP